MNTEKTATGGFQKAKSSFFGGGGQCGYNPKTTKLPKYRCDPDNHIKIYYSTNIDQ